MASQTICGWYDDVPSYDNENTSNHHNHINYIYTKYGTMYTGVKWQCVEFVRRYLILRHRLTFESVKNVHDLKNIFQFWDISTKTPVYISFHKTGNIEKNDILMLDWENTGHVAIVSDIDTEKGLVYTVDQNMGKWDARTYSKVYGINSKQIIGWIRY